MEQRYWEIDFLRGTAIIMMIICHFFLGLEILGYYSVNVYSGFWQIFARITASTFIFLVGISLTISYSRLEKKSFIKYLKRGLRIFFWGLLITAITWIFLKEIFIVFGVLHFIGISIILAYPFLKLPKSSLLAALGIILIFFGLLLSVFSFDFFYLLWLGFAPYHFSSLDYVPILPWFGVILFGIAFGKRFFPRTEKTIKIPGLLELKFIKKTIKTFCFLGRHSLLIYLIHAPIIILLLHIFFKKP